MVLVCGVHCACGSDRPAVVTAVQLSPAPHCHGHQGEAEDRDSDEHSNSEPCHHHGDSSTCDHCHTAVTAVSEVKNVTPVSMGQEWVGAFALVHFIQPLHPLLLDRSFSYGGLPPPSSAPTLLSLHCALTT
jgi:hypothetical protein